jgi:hypothetical protein
MTSRSTSITSKSAIRKVAHAKKEKIRSHRARGYTNSSPSIVQTRSLASCKGLRRCEVELRRGLRRVPSKQSRALLQLRGVGLGVG